MPAINAVGTNTLTSASDVAISAPETSVIVFRVASREERPSARSRSTFSTTTIASSTTTPIASTRPNSERLLSVKPRPAITASVPISDTGTASIGISVARQSCRKISTTRNTSTTASKSVFTTSCTLSSTNTVVS
jgi:hypothetical protein